MAARPESVTMLKMTDGPAQMPAAEGVKHLVRELYAGVPAAEVMITSWEYHGRFFGTDDHPKSPVPAPSPQPGQAPSGRRPSSPTSRRRRRSACRQRAEVGETRRSSISPSGWSWRWSRRRCRRARRPTCSGKAPACILGDNPSAVALRDRLVAAGVVVHMLPDRHRAEETTAAVEAVYTAHPFRYLFLMAGRDEQLPALMDRAGWQARRARGLLLPFLTAQQWYKLRMKAKDKSPIAVVAATSLGGDFGLSTHVAVPEGGALCGLLKSLYIEDTRQTPSEVRVKVIDAPADEPPHLVAEAILTELAASDPTIEVAWSRGARSVIRSTARPVESLSAARGAARRQLGAHRRCARHHGRRGRRVGQAVRPAAAPDRSQPGAQARRGLAQLHGRKAEGDQGPDRAPGDCRRPLARERVGTSLLRHRDQRDAGEIRRRRHQGHLSLLRPVRLGPTGRRARRDSPPGRPDRRHRSRRRLRHVRAVRRSQPAAHRTRRLPASSTARSA